MLHFNQKMALCIGIIFCLLLCGCTEEQPDVSNPSITLTALQYELENQNTDFSNMWFFKQLEEKTGIHVEFEEVKHHDWTTRLSLMFASNNFHDMILRGSLDIEEYGVTQHLLVPLDEYIADNMPNYSSRLGIDNSGASIASSDGNSYYIGFLLAQNINTDGHFFINKTWLNNLGLGVPTTIDELTDVLRAFRDLDPNNNGLNDEIPYQATFDDCNTGIYNAFSAWGIPLNEDFVFIGPDNKVHFAAEEPGFRECAEWMHLLCQEKLLDIECITQGSNLWGAKVNSNTSGYFSYWRLGNTVLSSDIASQFQCMLPVHADGHSACLGRLTDVVEFGAALTVQNEHISESLRWLDAQMEPETMLVSQNGPVGDTLRLRDDGRYEVVYVPETNVLYQNVPVICGQFFAPQSYYDQIYVLAAHRQEKSAYSAMYEEAGVLENISHRELTYVMPKTSDESARMLQLHSRLKTIIDSSLVSFMTDGITDESYKSFFHSLVKEGMEEYKELYQEAYDRYCSKRTVTIS